MSGVLSNELSLLKKTGSSTGSQGGVAAKKERNRKNRQERKQRKKNRLDSKLFEFEKSVPKTIAKFCEIFSSKFLFGDFSFYFLEI